MTTKIITYSFYLLFILTPLIWYPYNFELFEFNKMIFVYLLTIIITGAWILKMISEKRIRLCRTPLDIPILLFLGSQILSTIFSIDPHTSIFGYYSRSNGGLLSIISYLLLFYAFISNIEKEQALKILKFSLWGGLVVALYAIPEHFGVSLSCLILRGELGASCWVQDVQSRVFATLGQPNWLAAYLSMLIFPALYFLLTSKDKLSRTAYYLLLTTFYLAFTFTYSRGAMLGVLAGLGIFLVLYIMSALRASKPLLPILIIFLVINLIYGSALTRFKLTSLFPAASQQTQKQTTASGITQLENGGTESGAIRLIIWKGALEIFKHYPIFGSGVETFAYSYYQFRPAEHNLVSEWDFLYNKAHNEYLNYLSTTGIVGLGSYSIIIITFIIFILRKRRSENLLLISLLASYIGYLVQNFFGFSVVITALLFYLFPAFAFVLSDSTRPLIVHSQLSIVNWIYRRSIYTKAIKLLIILTFSYLLLTIFKMWLADTYFAVGERSNETGNPGKAYNNLSIATTLNPREPYYINELGYAAAASAVAVKEVDATLSAQLKEEAKSETEKSLTVSSKNTSFHRTAIRTYYQLTELDSRYNDKTIEIVDKTIALAPTDPKLYYNKAIILGQLKRDGEAMKALEEAIKLKPNYKEAYFSLALFQFDHKDYPKAVETIRKIYQIIPGDPDATDKLIEWGQKGIATQSAKL